jgi:alcohol dehydrogenase class IV
MMPAVLAFNAEVNADRQAEIAAALGADGLNDAFRRVTEAAA